MKSMATILTNVYMVVFAIGLLFGNPVVIFAQEGDTTKETSAVTEAAETSESLIKNYITGVVNWVGSTFIRLDDWRLEKAGNISKKIKEKRVEYEDAKDRREAKHKDSTENQESTSETSANLDSREADVNSFLSQPFILGVYVISLEIIYFVLITKVLFFALLGLIVLHLVRSAILVIVA